jgi:hypothetical protein
MGAVAWAMRRPHDHHRELRARQRSATSTDGSHGRDQDRHLMTVPKPQRRKATRLLSWLSTGHEGARSNGPSTPVLARQSSPGEPAVSLEPGSLLPADFANGHCSRSAPLSANPHSARSAIADPAPSDPSRFPPLEVFVRRPPERVAPSSWGRHPKTFTEAAVSEASLDHHVGSRE